MGAFKIKKWIAVFLQSFVKDGAVLPATIKLHFWYLAAVCVCIVGVAWSSLTCTGVSLVVFNNYANQAPWRDAVFNAPFCVTDVFLRIPLERLYMHGPALSGWGFWEGKRIEDICAELTRVPADRWELMRSECEALVWRQFKSFYVATTFSLYALVSYQVMSYMWFRYTVMNPIMHNVRMLLSEAASNNGHKNNIAAT